MLVRLIYSQLEIVSLRLKIYWSVRQGWKSRSLHHGLSLKDHWQTPTDRARMTAIPYVSAIKRLMYAMVLYLTWAHVCGWLVERIWVKFKKSTLECIKGVLRYLVGTVSYILCYARSWMKLPGYTDDDWSRDLDKCKSNLAYMFLLNEGAVFWRSEKQEIIVLFTIKTEYIAAASAIQQNVRLRNSTKQSKCRSAW